MAGEIICSKSIGRTQFKNQVESVNQTQIGHNSVFSTQNLQYIQWTIPYKNFVEAYFCCCSDSVIMNDFCYAKISNKKYFPWVITMFKALELHVLWSNLCSKKIPMDWILSSFTAIKHIHLSRWYRSTLKLTRCHHLKFSFSE